ncbi:hypothetical protein DFJ74DRAFT_765440 [Hyaloraphidium curvatum]|nr:hypothetical protein DFJ74DRAFT_765440 [Hyaloraphidium curvatum]
MANAAGDPDWLTCVICFNIMHPKRKPVLLCSDAAGRVTVCQHIFCQECIEGLIVRRCASCARSWSSAVPLLQCTNDFAKLAYRSAQVSCPERCGTKIQIWDIHTQLNNACAKAFVKCTHQGCGISVLRKDSERHLATCPKRTVKCSLFPLCNHEGPWDSIEQRASENLRHLELLLAENKSLRSKKARMKKKEKKTVIVFLSICLLFLLMSFLPTYQGTGIAPHWIEKTAVYLCPALAGLLTGQLASCL